MNTKNSKWYNLYNLEPQFKQYLSAGIKLTPTTVKNYLSDLRHFFGWYILYFRSNMGRAFSQKPTMHVYIENISTEIINKYKSYLIKNRIPRRTINRRLSTVRRFCVFCMSNGWMKNNPTKNISNVSQKKLNGKNRYKELLQAFKKRLEDNNKSPFEVNSIVADVNQFLKVIKT